MTDLILTRDQVRSIDRRAIEEYDMPGIMLMENAGRNAAEIIKQRYSGKIAIFAGPGNNGGDGFVIARHLHNAGYPVRIVLAVDEAKLKGDALINYKIVRQSTIPIESLTEIDDLLNWADVIVDALLGTGFSGQVRSPLAELIGNINAADRPIVAVDVPSGLDCQTGQPAETTIKADLTITFVAVKSGMVEPSAADYTGQIITADIGVPKELIDQVAAQA